MSDMSHGRKSPGWPRPQDQRPMGVYKLSPMARRALGFMRRACEHLESGTDPLPAMAAAWALIEAEDNDHSPDPDLMEPGAVENV